MGELSREEIDAKLAAAEARTEARFAQLIGTIDVRFASLDVRFASLDNKIDRLANTVEQLTRQVQATEGQLTRQVEEVRSDNKTTRWTIIGVVVASVLAGLAAIWITQGNMLAAFQSSLTVKTMQTEAPKH